MYKISLIIPIYKVEQYIEECIFSVLDQLNDKVQVVFVNDGTPDKSALIAKSIIQSYKSSKEDQILFINQDNQGLSGARNTGLKHSKGEFIGFLDSDDKLSSDYIDTVLKTINMGSFDIIDFNLVTSKGELIKTRQGDITSLESVFRSGLWYTCARVFKKSMFANHYFTSEIYYEDLALTPILYVEASNTFHVKKPLYWYRENADGITLNHSLESNIRTIESFEYILEQYINLYISNRSKYYAYTLMQTYYLLCTSASVRFSPIEAFRIINKYKLTKKEIIPKRFLSKDKTLRKRIYWLYKYPHTYISVFHIIHFLVRKRII